MKKILVVTMVLVLAIASVGCGSEKKEDNTTAASEAAKADGEAGNTSEAANYFKGSSAGKTYTNDVYGITFTSPEGQWIYAEPSELASRVGKTSDEVNSMTFEDVKGGKVFPAMMCTNMSSGESVSFILSASQAGVSEKDQIEATAKALGTQANVEVKEGSPIGSTYYCDMIYEDAGVNLYMRQYYIFIEGTAGTITVTASTKESFETLCNAWKAK